VSPRQVHDRRQRQEAAFRAYVDTGTVKGAAHRLGVSERAIRKHLAAYCDDNEYSSLVRAVFHFGTSQREAEH
jgi:predicted ArsR family transcriptional regulator